MNKIGLPGCTPEPLMSYLKALGVFRLVAEQKDEQAQLSWVSGIAQLDTKLDSNALMEFFLNEYYPTPIVAPWNGGSGFYGGGSEPLLAIEMASSSRFALYRETIKTVRGLTPRDKPKDDEKEKLLLQCRNLLSDEIGAWLDTCFVLGENKPGYFPLLGTGGNDGRLDFTNNFFQRLADVIAFSKDENNPVESQAWLRAALFADQLVPLGKTAIGQFNPGGIGGANGIQGKFEADSRVNPWEYVLMMEGVMLFAGSVARRMEANSTGRMERSVFPFCVESVAVGYGSATASEETTDGSRAELWLPLWDVPTSLAEIKHLFAEGRAQLGRKQAKNAVEFALAVNLLGVSRGITTFARYGFLKRNGLAFLASPLGRMEVTPRPSARLLDDQQLAEWLDRFRKACRDKEKTPVRYQVALRQIDQAIFQFSNRSDIGDDAKYLLDVLCALGRAERTLAGGLAFCKDKYLAPLQSLASDWLEQANDDSPEFRLAVSLAGIREQKEVGILRCFLEEVEGTKFVKWAPGSTSAVWSKQPLDANLAAVFRRRQMEQFHARDINNTFFSTRPARIDDVVAFIHEETDDAKLSDILWGLITIDWWKVEYQNPESDDCGIPFEFGLPRLVVEERTLAIVEGYWKYSREDTANIYPEPDVFHVLASSRLDAVNESVIRAARRLKSCGFLVRGYRNRQRSGKPLKILSSISPQRLLAAMLFPLTDRDLTQIANAVLYPPESED